MSAAFYPDNAVAQELCQWYACLGNKAKVIEVPNESFGMVVVCEDETKVERLRELASFDWKGAYPKVIAAGQGHMMLTQRKVEQIERENGVKSYATGYDFAKAHIYECLRNVKNLRLKGNIVEVGTFRGGTLALIGRLCDELGISNDVRIFGFDAWDGQYHRHGFLDMFGMKEYIAEDISVAKEAVKDGATLVKGDVKDSFPKWVAQNPEPIVFAFIDTDNYFGSFAALKEIWAKMPIGGSVVFDHFYTRDDFFDTVGEHVAAVDFFSKRDDYLNLTGTGVFTKTR